MRQKALRNRSQSKKLGLIFVISGPSGSGKSTLVKKLFANKEVKNRLTRSISFTTRVRRSREIEGKDYFFITQPQFQKKRKAKKILEWTRYLGYYYATPKDFVEEYIKEGRHIILCLDLKGALTIKRLYPENSVTIFIMPPSIKTLQARIESRCHKTEREEIKKRLELARKEILASRMYDYSLANKNLGQAIKKLQEIILKETGA